MGAALAHAGTSFTCTLASPAGASFTCTLASPAGAPLTRTQPQRAEMLCSTV